METNARLFDRSARGALGLVLLFLAFVRGLPVFDGSGVKYAAVFIGGVMSVTDVMRMFPLCAIFAIKTCRA